MPRYCIDMSGLSNPAQQMPQDIYTSLWVQIKRRIVAGVFATTPKVYEELTNLLSPIGECIAQNKDRLVYEVGIAHWDYECYLGGKEENKHEHKKFHVAEAVSASSAELDCTSVMGALSPYQFPTRQKY